MISLNYILGIVKYTYPVKVFRQKAIIVILPLYSKNWRSYEKDYMVTEILTRQSWRKDQMYQLSFYLGMEKLA